MNKIAAYFLFAMFASGCATSTLTQKDAQQFANLSLVEFLSARFQDDQSVSVKNTIRYLAYFNDVNFRQLERPTAELWNFCQAGSGKMKRIAAHKGDPVGKFFTTPQQAAWRGALYAHAAGRPDLAMGTAIESVRATEERNSQLGATEARKAYSKVLEKGAYGTWECNYEGGRASWRADILPISYAPPKDPGNLLTTHRMVIEITPYQ